MVGLGGVILTIRRAGGSRLKDGKLLFAIIKLPSTGISYNPIIEYDGYADL